MSTSLADVLGPVVIEALLDVNGDRILLRLLSVPHFKTLRSFFDRHPGTGSPRETWCKIGRDCFLYYCRPRPAHFARPRTARAVGAGRRRWLSLRHIRASV